MKNDATFRVYQASAGSGKTYTLVKEYFKLCLKSKAHVANFRSILAMTFTNAAANEIKERIVGDLCKIINNKEPQNIEVDLVRELGISDAELKENAQSLLTCIMHDYSSFCVCTIDTFVQKISRSFARELGLSSQYAVSIDSDDMANAVVESMGTQIGGKDPYLTQIVSDFCKNQFDNEKSDDLQYKLITFIGKLMAEKAYQRDENNNISNLDQYQEAMDFLNNKTKPFELSVQKYVAGYNKIKNNHGIKTEDFYYGNRGLDPFMQRLAKKEYGMPNAYFYKVIETGVWYSEKGKKSFEKSKQEIIKNELLAVLSPLQVLFEKKYPAFLFYNSQRDLLCLYALRTRIREEFRKIADEDEIVHISEFNKLINSVLGDYSVPFIYEKVGETFQHVFVDEFQDTSIMQWQNLLPLVDNGLSTNKMSMVVGDGKQSIYRFRSGEVEQLVNLPEIFGMPKDERHEVFAQYQDNLVSHFGFSQLDTNRRSFQNIIKFNNDFFEKTFKQLSSNRQRVYVDNANGYGKNVSVAQKTFNSHEGYVQVQLYDPKDDNFCFNAIANLISELLEKGYSYGDIAILIRKTTYGSSIANFLNGKNIPVVSRDSILLKSSNKVRLLVNTLRYLIDKSNEVVVANELYLWHLVNGKGNPGDVSLLFNEAKAIARGETDMESVLQIGEPGSFKAILSKATCLYDLCASLERIFGFNALDDAFLDFFMEEVFKWQNGIQESIIDFLAFWEKKQNALSVEAASLNAVNIMTIHKSKGLEFPVVIYPKAIVNLDEHIGSNNDKEEVWVSPTDLGFEPIPHLEKVLLRLDANAELMSSEAKKLCEEESNSNRMDNLNLLYVTFTRAKQRLYVFAEDKRGQNVISDYLKRDDLPAGMTVDEDCRLLQFGNPGFDKVDDDDGKKVKGTPIEKLGGELPSCNWFSKLKVDNNPSMFWMSPENNMLPSEWGDLVHEILSKVVNINDVEKALQPYLIEGVIDEPTAEMLKGKMMQMANHPIIGKAFGPEAKVKNECEILSVSIDEIKRPDRFVELPNEIILLDYKTGKKDRKHRQQLKDYIVALREMVTKDIRAYLVYLTDPIEVEEVVMDTLF